MPSKFCTSWIFLQIVSLCFVFLLFLGYSFNDPYTRPQCSSDRVIMFTNCCSQTTRYSMDQLYALRRRIRTTYAQLISPLVITRLHDLNIHRRRGRRGGTRKCRSIGVVLSRACFSQSPSSRDRDSAARCLSLLPRARPCSSVVARETAPPSLYIINANSLAKPHAMDQLSVELSSYNREIAIVTETHFKVRHH